MTVYEGSIITCDAAGVVARFLVEDSGRILFVGDALPGTWASAPRVVLGSKALLPAFGDTHIHFMSWALFSAGLDIRAAPSIAAARDMIADFVRARSPSFVLGFGASAHSVDEKRLLSQNDIDTVCADRPVFIVKYDGHAGVANSALISLVRVRLGKLRGFDEESGLMTQEAFFRVIDFVTGKVSLPATLGNMLTGIDRLAGYGVGLVHSVTGVGFPADMDVTLESLFARGTAQPPPVPDFLPDHGHREGPQTEAPADRRLLRRGPRRLLRLRGRGPPRTLHASGRPSPRAGPGHPLLFRREGPLLLRRGEPGGSPDRDARHRRRGLRPGCLGHRGRPRRLPASGPPPHHHPRMPADHERARDMRETRHPDRAAAGLPPVGAGTASVPGVDHGKTRLRHIAAAHDDRHGHRALGRIGTRPAPCPIPSWASGLRATTMSPDSRSLFRKRSTSTRATPLASVSTRRSAEASRRGRWRT